MTIPFYETLQRETEHHRQHVLSAPVIAAIQSGRFSLDGYRYFLTQAFHHVKHTVPLMMACGARLPERLEWVREGLVEYIEEEYGHHEWILNDLAQCGADKDTVRRGQPDLAIELMVSYLYDTIQRGNPIGFFGMVHVLEGTSVSLATSLGKSVQQQLGLPAQAFSYLYSHGELDLEHIKFFENLVNRLDDPADQAALIHAAQVCYRLYGDMLHAIPLTAQCAGAQHAAA